MKKVVAERYRSIDFSGAKRGAVVKPEPGKTKISIRLDNAVLRYFRALVDEAGGGNYQTLINDVLLEHIHRRSTLDVVRRCGKSSHHTGRRGGPTPGVSGSAPRTGEPERCAAGPAHEFYQRFSTTCREEVRHGPLRR